MGAVQNSTYEVKQQNIKECENLLSIFLNFNVALYNDIPQLENHAGYTWYTAQRVFRCN